MNKPAPPDPHNQASNPSWIERNVNLIIIALIVACVLSVLATFYPGLDHEHHHPHFEQEGWLGFQAAFGFITFVVIVFLGRGLRLIVQRKEDYYDRD